MNQFLSKVNRYVIALIGVLVLGISSVYAGTAYTNGRAFLKQGSPTGGGKVYVASNATEPTSGQYKAVTSSTSPAFNVQVDGNATFHYWAVANAGYIFTGWYTAEGALQSSGAAHISKAVTAGTAGTSDTHAYADFYASFIKQIQLSFVVPTNGSFTITHKGSEVTPAYSSFTTEGKVVLTALPADGYKLRGWYTTTNGGVTKNYFAFGNSCEPNFTSNTTIGAEFVPDDGKATFWIKGTNFIYDNLTDANTKAASVSSKMIVVVSDGVVGAGTYTISSGVTLLIPYEETYTLMTKPNIKHIPSPNAASKVTSIFRKLTLASGATVNVSGNICIGGSIASCNGGSPSSFPTGPVGMLDLSRGGTINLASGSNLYAWGYVKGQDMDQGNNTEASGVGQINAASNATVWEDYQVGEWRGGTASSTIYNNKGSWKFFPFQSYTVQNIEAPVNYAYGSNLKCFWTIFGNGSVYDVNFPLIASSGSLFKLASGGTVRKWYDPTTDHVCFELGGTAALDALTLSVMGETVSSSDYYLPIPANLKIILKSGNSLTVSKPMTMHAGSVVEVKSGATLNVNNRVHLFDADDWDTYCMYAYYYRTYYSPSLHFNRGEGTAKTNLEDATVIVDGTVDVKGAYLYSSAHGSNICGNGGGTFKYAALPSNTTMTQCKVLKDNVSVNIRSANLHNDNGTYTKGIASTTFKNVNGRWFTNAKATEKANHTYDFTYIKSGDVYGTGGTNATVAACWSKDKTGLELQDKWANIKSEGCDNWWTGIDDSHLYNWTRNSAWHQYIKTGSTTTGSGEEAVTTDTYVGSDGKMLYKTDCEFVDAGSIDGNCLYPSNKALVNGSLIAVTANTSPDHGYHATADASTYYLCFEGCVWHPATRNAENLYTVDGTKYIWYGDKWMAVEYDSGVSLHYSLNATNVKIYYEYVGSAWVLATPVAEVVTSAGTEQVFSIANAITKAKAGGTNVTIRLLKNISGTISYDGTNNCGLDLNGFTLSSSTSGMITVNSATATFIIKDQSAAGTGKVQLSYSANARHYAISVTKGNLVVNSGTISAINTMAYNSSSAKTVDVGAITVAAGHKVTVNGGSIEAISDHNPYGIYLAGATAMATINGGTIEAKTTERSSSVDSPYGIIGAGSIYVNGGTVKATCYRSSSSRGISSSGTFTMTGGSVIATASSTCYGVYAASGSNTTISGGTVTSTTTGGTARALISYATATVSGGTLTATAGGSDAKGIYVANGTTTVNAGAVVNATATTKAYGIYYADNTPTVTVNGGAFTVSTTSTTGSYGVYAAKGTGTINDGTFTVTAKTTGAEGMHVETANTPKLTLNGGKFMVKNSDGAANGTINNTGATLANFSMAGGYFNVAPNGTTNIAAGKTVKDLDATVEASLISAGYTKKIAGNEYTVTWCKMGGNTGSNILKTEKWESGKVPVWTGADPDLNTTGVTRVFAGWNTGTWNSGTAYPIGTPLPAITDHDVTYYAINRPIYAEVIADGKDSLFTSAQSAWKYAMKKTQATIRIKTQLGTEESVGNMTQMVFNPDNANSTITLDLNGLSWTMGRHATAANNTSPFIHVNPTQTGCKLIITDNSASGNGYLMNSWAKTDGDLRCVEVNAGELVLQKGGIKVKNTDADHYSYGVVVSGNNARFTMTGGTVYATDGKSPRGVNVANGYGDIAGGTVEANSTASEAYALLSYDTVTVSGGATLRAIGATGSTYGTYCNGAAAVLNIDSAIIISNAYQTAKGIYSLGGGQTTVDGKSSISATTTTGSGAYALYATGANTKITTNAGSYTATSALNSAYGVYAISQGKVIVNGGSFAVTATGNAARGVYAENNGVDSIRGGSFNVTSDTHADPSSFGAYATGGTVNIEDGNFTLNVHKDLSNRNCDLARCGTGASYLNISGGTFAGDSAYHAVRSFGGETMITGNPVFTAQRGVDAGAWASADGTAKVTIDGGTFYCTDNFALYATTHTYNGKTVVGDMTVLDGKFHTKSNIKPINKSSRPTYLKIKGGYFTSYTASDISNNALDSFVVAPSYTTAVESTDPMYASPNDYRYRVNTKFTVTWKDGATTLKTQEYNRNEIPSYGGDYNPSTSAETYEFLGWSPAIGPVTKDTTYTALKQKYEAEVFETGSATTKRYTTFEAAWADVQKIENGTLRILSNCYKGTTLTYNPAPAEGVAEGTPGYFTTATTTIDLNGHTYNNYTSTTDTYALEMKKAGCKLIITDTSGKTSGYFGHMNYNAPNCRYRGVKLEKGELVLAGGTLRTQNTYPYLADDSEDFSSSGAYTVLVYAGTTFTMTGGTLLAEAHKNARAVCFVGNGVANISGGEIKVLAQYKKKDDATQYYGAGAYGVIADNSGGTANISGTVTITSKANSSAIGVYVNASTNAAEANISGGSIDCWAKTQASMPVYCYQTKAVTNISGGSFKANCSQDASAWNTETVSVHKGATVNISGGTYESTTGSNCNAVRNFGGTVTITGNPLFKTRQGVNAGDYAEATATATVYVNGGTFNNKGYCFYANTSTNDNGTVTGKVYVNAGYFNSYGGSICSGTAGTNLVLNGGYYKERSGTSTKTNITTYKGATTTVSTLSPAITVADTTYHYQLLTDFNITWLGGESYSKVTQVKSGVVPTNTDLDGKCFLRNDSAFYFTGWTPTPIGVIGDATYNAAGVYHEAKVTVSAQDSIFDNFDEAWAYAMDQASATITLLTNLTRTTSIIYNPTPANARHTFDLNNFTIKENTTDRLLIVNKADAKLTITDNSSAKGGCLYKKMDSSANISTSVVYHGELILAGGKLYVENTKDDRVWHPAECVHVSRSTDGIFTMTGGTVESQAKYLAYPLYNYATMNISGGTIIANATTQGAAQGLYAVAGTATISGGTWNISSTTSGAVGVAATGWVNTTGTPRENGVLNITGGTFNVSAATSNVQGFKSYAVGKRIDGTNYTARGIVNVSGGTFNVTCSAATATQVFAAQVDGWRLFDDATPHNLIGEERGEINISGGTFTVDTRDNGAWVTNGGNVDLLRCWGNLNVTGGNFTIYQNNSSPCAIGVFRGKATVSGNPVFNVYGHTNNAYAVCAGYWTHENYCDKNAANNLAEAEVNGGTFKIITEGQNTNVIYALGQISAESRDGETITAHAGYAMNAKITVNGGEFLGICPNESGKYPILLNSVDDRVGTYGTAKSEIYVNGGKFKSRKGTEAENTATGAVNAHITGKILLTGGYYETNGQLATRKADTCDIINITSAEIDPEYANGYRYKIEPHYVAKVSKAGASDRFFCVMKDAFDYAKTQDKSTITLLRTVDDYEGPTLYYNPSTAMSCTLDLNGFTFKGQATSGEPDRLLIVSKGGCTFTIKDSSAGKTGKFSHEKSGATFAAIVYHGTLVLESGTVHCKNTSGNAQALRSTEADAIIQVTGGKVHAEATGTAYAVNSYGPATITGGLVLAEGSYARGVNSTNANADVKVKGNAVIKAIASAETAYGLYVEGGGKLTINENACDTAICTTKAARGAYVGNGQLTISGNAKIRANAGTSSYTVLAQGDNANATIEGGTITSYSSANSASITVYALLGATAHITGGTFYALCISGASNVSPIRTGADATMTIDGGTFYGGESGTQFQAVSIRGGETTINGGTFTAATGIRAMDWADDTTIKGKLTVNGGTFTTTGTTIYVSSKANDSRNAHSEVTINGGKFKSTGSNIVQMDATPDGADPSTLIIAGGYFYEKSGTTFKDQIIPFIADTSEINTLDPLYEGTYKYEVAPHYVASVTDGAVVTNYTTFKAAFDYARTINNSTVTILDDCNFETDGQYGYGLGTTGKTMTIDLNNHTVNATNSETSYDRVFAVTGQITITDNSVAKGGKLNLTKAHNGTFLGIVFNDASQLTLANGTIYVENTTASKAVEALNIWGTTGIFRQTGGTLQAKATSATATGVQMRGTAEISGGNITVTSVGSTARAFVPAADAGNSKYGSITVSGTPTITVSGAREVSGVYANVAGTTTTISGGTWNITSTTSTAYGVRLSKANTATISGGTFNVTATTTNAYGIYVSGGGSGTVSGGTFTSRTGANKNESFGAFATGTGTTLDITGGTFDVNSADNAGSNINVVRVQPGATVTISGGTFRSGANNGNGLVAFGGVTTVSGTALFEAYTGAYVGSWYSGDGTNDELATVNLNGGTFNVKGVAINVTWNTRYKDGVYLDSPFVNSIVNVNGGRYKTTGGTIVQKKANGADGGTAVLHIAGGYFNEKSGTTFKGQISPYVADTCDLNTLDPLLEGIYKYEVAPHYVAKVQTGSTTKFHTTAKGAFDYAKTVSNPTITLLDNCTLTSGGDANYNKFTANSWTGTLDLNNFTLTPTIDGEGRAFTVRGTSSKLTITDNSGAKGGKIYYQGPSTASLIYFVVEGSAEVELAAGTLYVEDTSADKVAVGFVVNSSTAKFTQSGGTFTVKGKYQAQGYYGSGTATFSGGSMYVEGETSQAIGLHPNAATAVLNVSGTFELDAKSTNNAYAVYAENGTATIEGTPDFYAESPTRARVLQGTSSGNLTVDGGTFEANGTTASQSDCYVLIPEGTSTITVNGGKFKNNQNNFTYKASGATLTINGGYFNETSGTNHKTKIDPYKGSGKVVLNLDTDDAEYIAGYRYIVTADPVAKVKVGSSVTYHPTVASAFKTANAATSASTITMLKDASVTSQLRLGNADGRNCTLDLNGHTITSTSSEQYPLIVRTSGGSLTITDLTESKLGRLDITTNFNSTGKSANPYGVYVYTGTFNLNAGTISVSCSTDTVCGIVAKASQTFTMNGGTLDVSATNMVGYGVNSSGTATIKNGTVQVAAMGKAYGIARSGGTFTVEDGKFNISSTSATAYATNKSSTDANLVIQGGWYTTNTRLATGVAAPYQVLSLAGQSPYLYEVAEAYTLTWTTDGDPLTGTYTSGTTKVGASIVAPNTPTKTGYTFSAWTPAVAATMPAANTTYTATWTINSFNVTFNMQGHGAAIAKQTIDYNGLVTEPATPTEANYVFGGWYKEAGCTNAWNFSTDHVTAATTLYAKWTAAEASVTVSGATTYYATLDAAWTAANSATAASTIKLLKAATVTTRLTYDNENDQNCTLDLNGHTITSNTDNRYPLYINNASTTFTITDGTVGKSGKLSITTTYSSGEISAVNLNAGTLLLEGGTIEVTTGGNHTNGVYVNSGTTFTMNDGIIHVTTTNSKRGRGVYTKGTTTINGGVINMETANNGTVVYYSAGTATINDGKFQITNNAGKYVVYPNSAGSNVKIKGGYYNAAGTYLTNYVSAPYHVFNVSPALDGIYTYEVAEGYTLTWSTDGDPLTGTYTSGTTKVGTTIVAPSTPTKTGYTFAGWSTTPAATMPAANTTYTATWTVNSYTIRFLNYDGSVLQSGSVNYGETPVYSGETPSKPADATYTYTFTGWSPAIAAVSGVQDYTAQFSQTANVASVTANASGYTRYYTDFSDAFKDVKEATVAVTITLLKDVSSPALVYSGINTDCTLDLNGHTLTNTNTSAQVAVNIYKAGTTFTITDKTESKSGQIRIVSTQADEAYGLYVYAGHLKLEAGTIYASLAANTCAGVRAVTANSSFTMDGGTIHLVTTGTNNGIGVTASNGTTIINGGTIHVETTSGDGYGIKHDGGTVTVNDGKFNISATGSAYATNLAGANASVVIRGGYYTTNSQLYPTAPYHVFDLTGESPYRYEVAEAYTLTWNLDGGSIATPGTPAGYVKKGATLTAPTVTKTGYTFAAWSPAVAATMPAANTTYTATWTMDEVGDRLDIVDWTATNLTINANGWSASGWPYTINGIEYAKDARAADRTLEIPYSGEAGTDLRITVESGGSIIRQHYYRIPFIGTADGISESDIIYVNSGNLTINASSTPRIAALYIRPEASVSITGGTLAIDKLVLRTLPWQAAAINGSFTAAETWYTRIAPNKRTITGPYAPITYESSSYYQFALPRNCTAKLKDVQVSHGANTPYGNTWLLKRYNEETRAANGTGEANWVVLDKEEYIQGGVGYEMSSNSNYYREFYFPLGAVNSASIGTTTAVSFHSGAAGAQHAGWNWVASPLMGVFDNSGADPETGMKIGWLLTDGSYDQGIPDYIYPAIPFSYQTSSGQSTISFAGSSIVASVPFRRVAAQEETVRLQWIHLDIQDTTGVGDHTSILAHPMRYEEAYKPGIDVAKQSFTASRALLYSSHAYGEMAFAGVSDSLLMRGVPLTIYSPVAQELTISMRANNWLDRLDHVWLVDYETGVRTDLLIGDYTFDAAAGTTAGRLVLEGQFKTPQIITGNEDVQDESTKPIKYIYQDKMYIQIGDKVYDATGKLVNKK